jgi:hypothetical protein
VRGQRRLHAPDRGRPQHAGELRDRGRPPADRLRGRLVGQAAGHLPGGGGLLRRRGHQHRRLPRGPQPGRGVEAAGAVRVREQPLHGVHLDQDGDRGGPAGGRPRPRLPAPGRGDRRQRRGRRAAGGGRRRGPGPGRRRPHGDRGPHLPPVRALAHRSGQVPAPGGGRRLAQARPAAGPGRAAPRPRGRAGGHRRGRRPGPRGVAAAAGAAEAAPAPEESTAFTDVWADGGAQWRT